LAVAGYAALVLIAWATGASAANIPISTCGPLTAAGNTYVLTADVGGPCPCFTVGADGITLDLNGHTVSGSCTGIEDGGVARSLTTVKNSGSPAGGVSSNLVGINLRFSSRTQILNVAVMNNGGNGIMVGSASLVKNCVVTGNAGDGIRLADRGQVQGCDVRENGSYGILGGDHALITQNDVELNALQGIGVADFSTVTFNTASQNGQDGIIAGPHSQITGNTANQNGPASAGNSGIVCAPGSDTAFCTVTFNTANKNKGDGIEVGGHSQVNGNLTNNNTAVGLEVNCPGTTPNQSNGSATNNSSSGNGVANYDISPGCAQNNNT
jgi:hypothetical protein